MMEGWETEENKNEEWVEVKKGEKKERLVRGNIDGVMSGEKKEQTWRRKDGEIEAPKKKKWWKEQWQMDG